MDIFKENVASDRPHRNLISVFRRQLWRSNLYHIPGIEKVKLLDQYTGSQRRLFEKRKRFLAHDNWGWEPDPKYGDILFSASDCEDLKRKLVEAGY